MSTFTELQMKRMRQHFAKLMGLGKQVGLVLLCDSTPDTKANKASNGIIKWHIVTAEQLDPAQNPNGTFKETGKTFHLYFGIVPADRRKLKVIIPHEYMNKKGE
jgi:hypothetical protein